MRRSHRTRKRPRPKPGRPVETGYSSSIAGVSDPIALLKSAIDEAVSTIRGNRDGGAEPILERPPKAELGDYSTNGAMLLAPALGAPPRAIAEQLREAVVESLSGSVDRLEVAGPGFLNLYVSDRWCREAVGAVLAAGPQFGSLPPGSGERVSVEFVSANPTGPLTAASGRHAAYGDAIANLLEARGCIVEREYYNNDAGGQIDRLVASVAARMRREPVPEDGYAGEYLVEVAAQLAADGLSPDDHDGLFTAAPAKILGSIEQTLRSFGVEFDSFVSERRLHDSGAVAKILADLRASTHCYESDGARWLRTTSFGDDKDRVLVRSSGEPTYLAADLAYHRDKLERGAERMISVLGADHGSHPPRIRAGLAALGYDPKRYRAPIIQMVQLSSGGARAKMSKRAGSFVPLDEVIAEIGADATRFLMLQRSNDSELELDLELAKRQSADNPVYYVQYAYARINSILRKSGEGLMAIDPEAIAEVAVEPSERRLIKRLIELPVEIEESAKRLGPHRLSAYGMAAAADFNAFYRDCKVLGAPDRVEPARLAVCVACGSVLARTLALLGVSAPESM